MRIPARYNPSLAVQTPFFEPSQVTSRVCSANSRSTWRLTSVFFLYRTMLYYTRNKSPHKEEVRQGLNVPNRDGGIGVVGFASKSGGIRVFRTKNEEKKIFRV